MKRLAILLTAATLLTGAAAVATPAFAQISVHVGGGNWRDHHYYRGHGYYYHNSWYQHRSRYHGGWRYR